MTQPREPFATSDTDVVEGLDYWRTLPIKQQPSWPDAAAVEAASAEIATLPPLVFAGEVDTLRSRLASAARGEAFLLQGGDCAESFAEFNADKVRVTYNLLLKMGAMTPWTLSVEARDTILS